MSVSVLSVAAASLTEAATAATGTGSDFDQFLVSFVDAPASMLDVANFVLSQRSAMSATAKHAIKKLDYDSGATALSTPLPLLQCYQSTETTTPINIPASGTLRAYVVSVVSDAAAASGSLLWNQSMQSVSSLPVVV